MLSTSLHYNLPGKYSLIILFMHPCLTLEFLMENCLLSRLMMYSGMDKFKSNHLSVISVEPRVKHRFFFNLFIWETVDFLLNYFLLRLISA